MITLGIDISLTNCGIAVYRHGPNHNEFGSLIHSDVSGYRISSKATVRDRVRRISTIVQSIIEHIDEFKPDYVVIEGPSYGSQSRQVDLGGLHYTVYYELIRQRNIEPIVMPPKTARKKAFGSGSPPKDFPKSSARTKKWVKSALTDLVGEGMVPKNEHVRDALVLCLAQQGWSA